MKRKIYLIEILLMVLFLVGCSTQTEKPVETVSEPTAFEEITIDLEETEVVYPYFYAYKDRFFQEFLNNNDIDSNFEKEYEYAIGPEGGGAAVRQLYVEYTEMWKDEMEQSTEFLCTLLDDESKELVLSSNDNFQESLDKEMKFAWDTLAETSGSSFTEFFYEKYMASYRNRTFEIKYFSYRIEEIKNNFSADKSSYRSLVFYNP